MRGAERRVFDEQRGTPTTRVEARSAELVGCLETAGDAVSGARVARRFDDAGTTGLGQELDRGFPVAGFDLSIPGDRQPGLCEEAMDQRLVAGEFQGCRMVEHYQRALHDRGGFTARNQEKISPEVFHIRAGRGGCACPQRSVLGAADRVERGGGVPPAAAVLPGDSLVSSQVEAVHELGADAAAGTQPAQDAGG
jgi:hypothetical protein